MLANKALLLSTCSTFLLGCASGTKFRDQFATNLLVGSTIGYAVGSQKEEFKSANGVMYGAIGATIAAIYTVVMENPDEKISQLQKQNTELAKSVGTFTSDRVERVTDSGLGMKGIERLPAKYRSLISPGEWRVYEIDDWERLDENRLVHRTEMLEIIPPNIKR